MELVIDQVTVEAKNVLSLRLKAADGATLPNWEPGRISNWCALGPAPALLAVW
jgi:hypothetical protein